MRRLALLFLVLLGPGGVVSSLATPPSVPAPKPGDTVTLKPLPAPVPVTPPAPTPAPVSLELQTSLDRLTQSNRDLLDLLKKQQAVLEDIQYDRRLQSRQIQSLEERLQETLVQNTQLQSKVDALSMAAAVAPTPTATPQAGAVIATPKPPATNDAEVTEPPPAPPSTYLPAPEGDGPAGTMWWHRLFTLSGTDGQDSQLFQIKGRQWRVVWHNQDPEGKAYVNTSALFISAFPKDDTIPLKVCSKLGTGGDATELTGTGNYYLKVEASGGKWELAVEDFR